MMYTIFNCNIILNQVGKETYWTWHPDGNNDA